MIFQEIADKIKQIDMVEIAFQAVDRNQEEAIELNKSQLLDGRTAKGGVFPPYKSASYARKKGRPNPDLKLTGAFQGDFISQSLRFPYEITSLDEKTPRLEGLYGRDNIFGLDKNNLQKFTSGKVAEDIQKGFLLAVQAAFKSI